ncbi:diguanylate cyclase domain-containing protein [Floridanema evergladense]|uniref:Diguanylate cyclase domain-containing protein n=1 Tax=Floridaenema evergladense BLCC-F167 TaxID=3153639 RepID=A0ABV4WV34_9CYAN
MQPLSLESTLQDLTLYDFTIESGTLSKTVITGFEKDYLLPGVVITENGQLWGMISRREFLERMSRPYSLELFSRRPISSLYSLSRQEPLVLPSDTLIVTAAKRSLWRSPELVYEPVIVEVNPKEYRLLDVHQLLVAQSDIHELANLLIRELYNKIEKANQELQRLATVDGLTNLANRRQFDQYLSQQWQQMRRHIDWLSLVIVDVDYFKLYNDNYGHLAGDFCLQEVAKAIKNSINRSTDLVARYGGEEFAVILPATSAEGAIFLAEKIIKNVRTLEIAHEKSPISSYVTVSLGVASMIPDLEMTPANLITSADEALYAAKASGRDRYILHSSLREQQVHH